MQEMKPIPPFDHTKFLKYISVDKNTGCWNWVGSVFGNGYGIISITNEYVSRNQRKFYAHRVSFSLFKQQPSTTMVIDHKCQNKKCVNPKHLHEVTNKINILENSNSAGAVNKRKTHCKRGHELSKDPHKPGYRICKVCVINYRKNIRFKTTYVESENGLTVGLLVTNLGFFTTRICIDKVRYYIGTYKTQQEAIVAYEKSYYEWFGKGLSKFKKVGK